VRPFKDWLIPKKLFSIMVLVSVISLALVSFGFLINDIRIFEHEKKVKLQTLAQVIGMNSQASLAFSDADAAKETLSALQVEKSIDAAGIYDSEGRLFAAYRVSDSHELAPVLSAERMRFRRDSNFHQYSRIILNGRQIGLIYLRSNANDLKELIRYYLGWMTVVLLIAVLATGVLSFFLQRLISAPIVELTGTVQKIGTL
jgi:two-component system, NtrC family, sensor kinase